jgi:hypothetical protein
VLKLTEVKTDRPSTVEPEEVTAADSTRRSRSSISYHFVTGCKTREAIAVDFQVCFFVLESCVSAIYGSYILLGHCCRVLVCVFGRPLGTRFADPASCPGYHSANYCYDTIVAAKFGSVLQIIDRASVLVEGWVSSTMSKRRGNPIMPGCFPVIVCRLSPHRHHPQRDRVK